MTAAGVLASPRLTGKHCGSSSPPHPRSHLLLFFSARWISSFFHILIQSCARLFWCSGRNFKPETQLSSHLKLPKSYPCRYLSSACFCLAPTHPLFHLNLRYKNLTPSPKKQTRPRSSPIPNLRFKLLVFQRRQNDWITRKHRITGLHWNPGSLLCSQPPSVLNRTAPDPSRNRHVYKSLIPPALSTSRIATSWYRFQHGRCYECFCFRRPSELQQRSLAIHISLDSRRLFTPPVRSPKSDIN